MQDLHARRYALILTSGFVISDVFSQLFLHSTYVYDESTMLSLKDLQLLFCTLIINQSVKFCMGQVNVVTQLGTIKHSNYKVQGPGHNYQSLLTSETKKKKVSLSTKRRKNVSFIFYILILELVLHI